MRLTLATHSHKLSVSNWISSLTHQNAQHSEQTSQWNSTTPHKSEISGQVWFSLAVTSTSPLPIVTKHELGLPFPPRNLPIKFGTNPSTIFLVIVVTDRHTDKPTLVKTYSHNFEGRIIINSTQRKDCVRDVIRRNVEPSPPQTDWNVEILLTHHQLIKQQLDKKMFSYITRHTIR